MNRGYNNYNRFDDNRQRSSQPSQRYDGFFGNKGKGHVGYGNKSGNQHEYNQNDSGQVFSASQQQDLLNALIGNQNVGSSQIQDRRGPKRDVNMNYGRHGRDEAVNRGSTRGSVRGGNRGGVSTRGGPGNRGSFSNRASGFASRGGPRSGEKRSFSQSHTNRGGKKFAPPVKKAREPIKEPEKKPVEEEVEILDEEIIVSDTLKEVVEKLRERVGEIDRNAVDEDVGKLKVFSHNGKGYRCASCNVFMTKEASFSNHLMSKNHVMKVIDDRTAKKYQDVRSILDIDLSSDDWFEESDLAQAILKNQAKEDLRVKKIKEMKNIREYNSTPSNFYRFGMELRKSVIQVNDEVVITSLVESTVSVRDFTEGRHFGCEFVRAVTGFHCRLCSINIRDAKGVLSHIGSKLHKSNYATYIAKNKDYEKRQLTQNKDIHDIMTQHDGNSIVLAESKNADCSRFLSQLDSELVRIPSVMNPQLKLKSEMEKEPEEKSAENEDESTEESKDTEDQEELTEDQEETAEDEEEIMDEDVETASEDKKDEDEEETAEDEEETAEDEEETAADEEETAADEEETVADEEETVADEEETIADEDETAADEEETAADEEETAADEEETAADEEETAADEEETAADEEETAADEEETAADQDKKDDDPGEKADAKETIAKNSKVKKPAANVKD